MNPFNLSFYFVEIEQADVLTSKIEAALLTPYRDSVQNDFSELGLPADDGKFEDYSYFMKM